jgi:hypothetical protein
MKSFLIGAGILFFLALAPYVAFGQPGGGGPGGEPSVPVTGIEILVVIGGALGVRKIINLRKKNIS